MSGIQSPAEPKPELPAKPNSSLRPNHRLLVSRPRARPPRSLCSMKLSAMIKKMCPSDSELRIPAKNCYRMVVLGSSKVGKTAIVSRFLTGRFEDAYTPTIEDFHRKFYCIRGEIYQLDILDTSGNHPFPAMRRLSILTGEPGRPEAGMGRERAAAVTGTPCPGRAGWRRGPCATMGAGEVSVPLAAAGAPEISPPQLSPGSRPHPLPLCPPQETCSSWCSAWTTATPSRRFGGSSGRFSTPSRA